MWWLIFKVVGETLIKNPEALAILKKAVSGNILNQLTKQTPTAIIARLAKQKILGTGTALKELQEFQQGLQQILNNPLVKKNVLNSVKQRIKKEFASNLKSFQNNVGKFKGDYEEFINTDQLKQDDIVGVTIGLNSTALSTGFFIPVKKGVSGTYGILSLTYISNLGKSYDYYNVSLDVWQKMAEAPSGANSIFINSYLGGINKTRKEMNADVRKNVNRLYRGVTTNKSKATITYGNYEQAKKGYQKYAKYGLKK